LFASLGANVFAFSVDSSEMRAASLGEIKAAGKNEGQRFETASLDVSDNAEVQRVLRAAAESFGPPFVIVCSAGIGGAVYFENLPFERFDRMIKINLYGTRNVIAALLPFMKNGGGYIVNISSMSGLMGLVGYTAYSSSKFGVVGFSQSLRAEMKKDGIWVSVVCPPQVATPLLEKSDKYKPPETKALNDRAGLLSAREVADAILSGMSKKRFLIIPGTRARLFYSLNRLLPRVREYLADRTVRKIREKLNRQA
jgi:3-dehydrosphinganine reductase